MKLILVTAAMVLLSFGLAAAEGFGEESFYVDCIDQRIKNCDLKARLIASQSESIRSSAKKSMNRADFYRSNKDELAAKMNEEAIPKNSHRVNYYLIKAYTSD